MPCVPWSRDSSHSGFAPFQKSCSQELLSALFNVFFQSGGLSTSVWMCNQNFLFVSWLQSLRLVGLGRISPVACVLPRIHPPPPLPPPLLGSHFLVTTAVSVEQLHGEVRLAAAPSPPSPRQPRGVECSETVMTQCAECQATSVRPLIIESNQGAAPRITVARCLPSGCCVVCVLQIFLI